MPFLVSRCFQSWILHNEEYEVVLLTEKNLSEYVQIDQQISKNKNITIQAMSDIIRVNLLAQRGGIWVDATCFCLRPLDDWVKPHFKSGFFAFSRPSKEKLVSSWFLFSKANGIIISKWMNKVNSFWIDNPNLVSIGTKPRLAKTLNRLYPRIGIVATNRISSWLISYMNLYPYFFFHYFFNKLYKKDCEFKIRWDKCNKLSADGPHLIQNIGFNEALTSEVKEKIDSLEIPVFKLSYKLDYNRSDSKSVLNFLLESSYIK